MGISQELVKADPNGLGKLMKEGTDVFFIQDQERGDGVYSYAVKDMLLQAGFTNVELREKPLSPDGSHIMFTVTAEKAAEVAH